jgi:2-oxo-3-hexenedioate decarboxylase
MSSLCAGLQFPATYQPSRQRSTNSQQTGDTVDSIAIAKDLLKARRLKRQISPISAADARFDAGAAYDVAAEILKIRRAGGEVPVGRKIGFTNSNIWPQYGVSAPIWGYVYDSTLRMAHENAGVQSLKGALEPKIEPEIVFCLRSAPKPGMSEEQLAECIDWVAHGFEIVHSVYPGWRFQVSDTIAAFGMHGVLIVGQPRQVRTITGLNRDLVHELKSFKVSLFCDGELRDSGSGTNVLGSPLLALKHMVDLLGRLPQHAPLAAGEIVTTGTLTAALDIKSGQTWHTAFTGLDLPGLRVRFV